MSIAEPTLPPPILPAPTPPTPPKSYTGIIIAFLVLVILALSGFIAYTNFFAPKPTPPPSPTPITTPTSTPDPTANWKTYINTQYSFSFKYPPEAQLGSSEATTRIQVSLGKIDITCGYPFQFTVVYSGYDLQKHNETTTYQTQVDQKTANRYDTAVNLEGCSNVSPNIYIPNISNPTINDLVIAANYANKQEYKTLFDLILQTFKFTN